MLQLFFLLNVDAQCLDVYSNKVDCPTMADSVTLYNNAVKVINFYETNPNYTRTGSDKISSAYDKLQIFQQLADARRMFKVIRRQFPSKNIRFKDITYDEYYQEIDEYRFYQRELENQTVNREAAPSLYDLRISPVVVNRYTCNNIDYPYYGDLVNIPLYVPVVVKPFMMLNDSELVLRNAFLNIPPPFVKYTAKTVVVDSVPVKKPMVPSLTEMKYITAVDDKKYKFLSKYNTNCPVYYFEDPLLGGPALIGTLNGRNFVSIRKEDYKAYAVPVWAQKLLNNTPALTKYLKLIYGEYLLNVY